MTIARQLAERYHAGQVDKVGAPYISHLERVVAILKRRWWADVSEDEISAAWLHDVLEDTAATPADLRAAGISERAISIVERVTKPEGIAYLDWIRGLAASGDRSGLRVKLADNEDNRDPVRVAALASGAERVARRYEPARLILEAALRRGASEK